MKVYNTFFKIIKKNSITIIIYIAISVFIALLSAKHGVHSASTIFEQTKIPIAVIDRDKTATSQGIIDYFDKTQILVTIDDNKETFQDELFYRNVIMIVIIPENFETDLIAGKETNIKTYEVPNSFSGTYIEMQLEQYLNMLKDYLTIGVSPADALAKTDSLMSQQVSVSVKAKDTRADSVIDNCGFFSSMPYAQISIILSVLGMVLIVFYEDNIKRRTICSSCSLKRRNFQIALGCFTVSVAIQLLLLVIPVFLFGTKMFSEPVYGFLVLNSIAMTICCTALGFLVGIMSNKMEQVVVYSTFFTLGLSFFGGIFIPLDVIPQAVKNVSKFLPTYWYSTTFNILSEHGEVNNDNLNHVLFGIGIQLVFAIAVFGISLIVTNRRNQHV